MKKIKGFTLIELLAVILILGIIALIAIPTVNEIIIDSKKGALKTSAENIVRAAEQQCNLEKIGGRNITESYSIENGSISSDLNIKSLPNSGTINVDDECNAKVAVTDGNFCVIREGENTTINSNSNNCTFDYVITPDTEESCFIFDEATHTITGYNFANASCPSAIVIPATINNIPVEHIGEFAFTDINGQTLLYTAYHKVTGDMMSDIKKENISTYDLVLKGIEFVTITGSTQKACYTEVVGSWQYEIIDDINYIGNASDGYKGCRIGGYGKINSHNRISLVDFTKASNLKTIGDGAFMYNSITNVYFDTNNTFEHIGVSVFANNVMTGTVNLAGFNYNEIPNSMFYKNSIEHVIYNNKITAIGYESFSYNSIVDYNLPNSLVNIGIKAFALNNYESPNLTQNFVIPDSVVTIGNSAFAANSISKLTIGAGVKVIDNNAFNNSKIATLILHDHDIDKIGVNSFLANNLTSIPSLARVKNLGNSCFNFNKVPTNSNNAYVFKKVDGVEDRTTLISVGVAHEVSLSIPNELGIKVIAAEALQNFCFTELVIPDSVETIESKAISSNYVKNSYGITIGNGVTSIAPDAFDCDDEEWCKYTIKINKSLNSVDGAKWGNEHATIVWTG